MGRFVQKNNLKLNHLCLVKRQVQENIEIQVSQDLEGIQ